MNGRLLQGVAQDRQEEESPDLGRSLAFSPRVVDFEAATPQGFGKAPQARNATSTPDTEIGMKTKTPQMQTQQPGTKAFQKLGSTILH